MKFNILDMISRIFLAQSHEETIMSCEKWLNEQSVLKCTNKVLKMHTN